MDRLNSQAYFILIARLVLSAAFLLAALPKIQDPVAFTVSVEGFRVVSGQTAVWVALLLPWLELVIGIGLLVPPIRRGSGLLVALLLLAFIGLHASAWVRGLDINCGCFGQSEGDTSVNYIWLILRNTALLAAAVAVLARDWRDPRRRTQP
jgi:uncharacterized membrane protein YphA (DoxX/SURF4 family)